MSKNEKSITAQNFCSGSQTDSGKGERILVPEIRVMCVSKTYRIWESVPSYGARASLARIFLGESFKGRVEVQRKPVVKNVSLDVERAEIIGLLGPNGAGKSTLLEMMAGGISPDEGSVELRGKDISSEPSIAGELVTPFFPVFGMKESWTGRQNLEYAALLYNIPRNDMISRMKDVLELTGLSSRADDMVSRYSTGMKVKLTLAAGLMIDNPIYLMDEPFVGIDPAAGKEIRGFLRRELKTRERTVLMATHILKDVEELCDRVALMKDGQMVVVDTIDGLKKSLCGTESVRLRLEADEAFKRAVPMIRDVDGVKDCGIVEEDLSSDRRLLSVIIRASDGHAILNQVIDFARKRSARIVDVHIGEPTMEDVFMKYVGGGLTS